MESSPKLSTENLWITALGGLWITLARSTDETPRCSRSKGPPSGTYDGDASFHRPPHDHASHGHCSSLRTYRSPTPAPVPKATTAATPSRQRQPPLRRMQILRFIDEAHAAKARRCRQRTDPRNAIGAKLANPRCSPSTVDECKHPNSSRAHNARSVRSGFRCRLSS